MSFPTCHREENRSLLLYSVDMVDFISGLPSIEVTVHSRNKSKLVRMDFFYCLVGLSVITSHVPNRQEGKPGLSLNGKMPSDQCLIPQLCFDTLSHQLCRIFGLVTCVTL